MRTVEVKIYKYEELSDEAKEKARQDYAVIFGYSSADEALESMKSLAEHFGGKITDYGVDFFGSSYSSMGFEMPDMDENEIAERLAGLGEYNPETLKGLGECKLTGWCYDEDAIDGFRMAWHKGKRDLNALMQAAFKTLLKSCQSECSSFYNDEGNVFAEHCEANNYEFYEDGSFYK